MNPRSNVNPPSKLASIPRCQRGVERLKAERAAADGALAELDGSRNGATSIDVDDVFDAFRLSVAIDKHAAQIHVRALVSSALTKARDLQSLVDNESIAGAGFEPATSGL